MPNVALVAPLFGKALVERTKIRCCCAADLLYAVACRHLKVNSFSIDVDYLCRRAHFVAYRRGGESVVHLPQCRRRLHRIQKRSYGIELSVFYHQNYRGRREHLRQYGVVESVGKVFGLHPQCLEAECSGSGRQRCKSSR